MIEQAIKEFVVEVFIEGEPGKLDDWRSKLEKKLELVNPRERPLDMPISVECEFIFEQQSKRINEIFHFTRPDMDHLTYEVFNAMQTVGIYRDDSRICDSHALKRFCGEKEKSGTRIKVWFMNIKRGRIAANKYWKKRLENK